MIDSGCIEVNVHKKTSTLSGILWIIATVLAVCFVVLGLIGSVIFLIPGAAFAVGAVFAYYNRYIDYEYSLVDRELRIAKIMNRSRRKHLVTFDLDTMEIMAPADDDKLSSYRARRDLKVYDFSDHDPQDRQHLYEIYLEGKDKVILTLEDNEYADRLLMSVRQFAPHKLVLRPSHIIH